MNASQKPRSKAWINRLASSCSVATSRPTCTHPQQTSFFSSSRTCACTLHACKDNSSSSMLTGPLTMLCWEVVLTVLKSKVQMKVKQALETQRLLLTSFPSSSATSTRFWSSLLLIRRVSAKGSSGWQACGRAARLGQGPAAAADTMGSRSSWSSTRACLTCNSKQTTVNMVLLARACMPAQCACSLHGGLRWLQAQAQSACRLSVFNRLVHALGANRPLATQLPCQHRRTCKGGSTTCRLHSYSHALLSLICATLANSVTAASGTGGAHCCCPGFCCCCCCMSASKSSLLTIRICFTCGMWTKACCSSSCRAGPSCRRSQKHTS